MNRAAHVFIAISVGAMALPAMAAENDPWYFAIRGGAAITQDSQYESSATGLSGDADHKTGIAFGAGIGYDFGDAALEFELVRRQNTVETVTLSNAGGLGTGTGRIGVDGKTRATAGMLNLYYAPDVEFMLKPYVGFGMGMADVDYKNHRLENGLGIADDSKMVFAYQGIAGLRYAISRAVDMTLDYRYFSTENPKLSDALGRSFKGDYDSHAFMVGLVWRFGGAQAVAAAPEPAYVAAPAPAPEPTPPAVAPAAGPQPVAFIIYFDWDSSAITTDAARILDEAAQAAKGRAPVKVVLKGHTDTSGKNAYNDNLAQRRVVAAEQELVARGVAADSIAITSFGEEQPAVSTEDGVREPMNRRVEITIE